MIIKKSNYYTGKYRFGELEKRLRNCSEVRYIYASGKHIALIVRNDQRIVGKIHRVAIKTLEKVPVWKQQMNSTMGRQVHDKIERSSMADVVELDEDRAKRYIFDAYEIERVR